MLDADTKRRIDTARDILVGKVPDPKSQVEQITIALIYKFMDDIDAESEELGGERSFFTGDFSRYGWAKLMRAGLGGHDTLNLYDDAIRRMPQNSDIPQLFRNIFKDARLPYGDPETLRAFLKVIDEFTYDHSERLGDAFEYLLSVLGSQGHAGQFRTPRHIIDFIVEIVDPKKDEKILDPACGTAGFLISAYKHVLENNTDEDGGSALTPEEQTRLAANLKGYDISPDMVRLSLANMYLHGFTDPHISEYDTLTSEDNWNEYADVILANPPFMSPKGGIRPHNRFSVPSRRSEVLFVDYMATHLTPGGRAGIIVPEGIIFQSQNAHKRLRRMLVEDYLVAVVSLPAGVFQPYSGVKTSVLILDKPLARRTNHVAFFKIDNDGYDLGAQRREIDKNDLPGVEREIKEYLRRLRSGESLDDFEPTHGLIVEKEKIEENGEYNLSGERYRENVVLSKTKWPLVELGDVCEGILSGGTPSTKNEEYWNGDIPWITSADIVDLKTAMPRKYITEKAIEESATNLIPKGNLIVVTRVGLGKLFRNDFDVCISQDSQGLIIKDEINADYLVYVLKNRVENFKKVSQGSTIQGVTKKQLSEIQIPLPPLDIQKEIVAEIEGHQKVIDGARAVVDNYRPHIAVDPEWPMMALGEVCEFKRGPFGGSLKKEIFVREGYAIYEQSHAISQDFTSFRYFIDEAKFEEMKGFEVQPEDIIMSCSGTMGRTAVIPDSAPPGIINQALLKLRTMEKILTIYLKLWMESFNFQQSIENVTFGAAIKNVASVKILKSLEIPLPPLETQHAIVAEIEAEQAMVESNRKLIERFEKKIEAVIARVWGEDVQDD